MFCTVAKPEHIAHLAANMREIDRREVWAMSRITPLRALQTSLAASDRAFTYWVEGLPAVMWGIARPGSLVCSGPYCGLPGRRIGRPWLLATNDLYRDRRGFLALSRFFADILDDGFDRIENWICADNRDTRRWLALYGVQFADRPDYFNGVRFLRFWRDNSNV